MNGIHRNADYRAATTILHILQNLGDVLPYAAPPPPRDRSCTAVASSLALVLAIPVPFSHIEACVALLEK